MCPLYAAGEKRNLKFDTIKFANLIAKNSRTQVIIVNDESNLSKYLKRKFEIVADNLENTINNVDLALAVSNTGASVDMYLLNIPLIIFTSDMIFIFAFFIS